jgi:hypothetical protein
MTDEVQETTAQEPNAEIECILCHLLHPLLPESGPPYSHYDCTTYGQTVALTPNGTTQ